VWRGLRCFVLRKNMIDWPPRPRFPWPRDESPDTLTPMSPNRRELKPDRRAQEQERAQRRGVMIRDACWALIIAVIVVGGAKLVAQVFGAP
jgi:hypothetical protein